MGGGMGTESGKLRAFEIADLVAERAASGEAWNEFLRVPALSMGMYALAAGADDPQTPHDQDEVYYVVSGRGVLQVEDDRAIRPARNRGLRRGERRPPLPTRSPKI